MQQQNYSVGAGGDCVNPLRSAYGLIQCLPEYLACGRWSVDQQISYRFCAVIKDSNYKPHMATEHLKCALSELRCVVSIKIPDFKDLL